MLSKSLSVAAVALAASTLVSAQTSTACNPLEKSCPDDKAFGKNAVDCDFTQGICDAFSQLPGTDLSFGANGAVFEIQKETNAPTIQSGLYIFFGRIDVEVQAAAGSGIVTSCVLQSDDLDEIDLEWVGGDDTQVQSNYFSKGDTTTYDRGAYHPVDAPLSSFHTYSVEWTPAAVNWIIDGNVVRTLTYESAKGGATFPQTPMQIKLGTWVAGRKDAPEGTVEWAGGYTNFADAPFQAFYKSIKIVDYAGTSGPAKGDVSAYAYGDHSGTYKSIVIKNGDGSSADNDDQTTTTKKPSKTTKAAPESTTSSEEPTSTSSSSSKTSTKSKTVHKTTSSATTMSTATSSEATTTSEAPTSTSAAAETTADTTTAAPATESSDSAAAGTVANVALVGAGLFLAQLLV